jgi:hypothetical protein
MLLGASAFAAGVLSLAVAAKKRETAQIRVRETEEVRDE